MFPQRLQLLLADPRLEQSATAVLLRAPAAERPDVEGIRRECGGEGRDVELVVVRQHDDRRVTVGNDLLEGPLRPLDDDLVGARHPLRRR